MEVSNFRLTEVILELPEVTSVSQDQVTPKFSCVCKVRARNAKGKDGSKFITTDEDGHANLTLPSVTRSYCWADFTKVLPNGQEERLRWLVLVPDEIDANGTIIMSHDNVYSADSITALPNPNNTLENRNIGNR